MNVTIITASNLPALRIHPPWIPATVAAADATGCSGAPTHPMHYSFIYRDRRIDENLLAHQQGWQWRQDLHDGLRPHTNPAVFESRFAALQSACSQARHRVDFLLSRTTVNND